MLFSLPVVALLLCAAIVGLVPALVDHLTLTVGERLGLNRKSSERLAALYFLCWVPGMPLAGWLIDQWDRGTHDLLFYSLVGIVFALASLGLTKSVLGAIGNIALLGLAYSAAATSAIHAMPKLLSVGDTLTPVAALNLGFLALGIASLVGPWIVRRLELRFGVKQTVLALAFSLLVPAVLIALAPASAFPARAEAASAGHVLYP